LQFHCNAVYICLSLYAKIQYFLIVCIINDAKNRAGKGQIFGLLHKEPNIWKLKYWNLFFVTSLEGGIAEPLRNGISGSILRAVNDYFLLICGYHLHWHISFLFCFLTIKATRQCIRRKRDRERTVLFRTEFNLFWWHNVACKQ
jgi:hypothetical protein